MALLPLRRRTIELSPLLGRDVLVAALMCWAQKMRIDPAAIVRSAARQRAGEQSMLGPAPAVQRGEFLRRLPLQFVLSIMDLHAVVLQLGNAVVQPVDIGQNVGREFRQFADSIRSSSYIGAG